MNAPIEHTATPADVLAGRARWCVVEGDCADVLRALPDGGVDALVSDPPSGIAFMGAEWDRDKGGRLQWVAWLSGILSDARRATRDGGRAIVWSLPRTSHWTGCAVEDAGWSIETTIAHLFGTGWPKGASQLKPAQETWWLARTGKSEALNVEACRVTSGGPSPSIRHRETAARTGVTPSGKTGPTGWENRNSPEHYTAPREGELAGRYPPNLLLSHVEGCVCEGTRQAPRNIVRGNFNPSKRARNAYGIGVGQSTDTIAESVEAWRCVEGCPVAELDRQSGVLRPRGNVRQSTMGGGSFGLGVVPSRHHERPELSDTGTASRFFYQAKASSSDRLAYITCTAGCAHHDSVAFQKDARDSARDPSREQPHGLCRACNGVRTHYGHPTVKPLALAAYHARLLSLPPHTRPIALVPFCGTGIEARALLDVGFRVIAIDLDPRHCAMTTFRLTHKEPEHVTEERAAVTEAERGDWTKPIRVSEVAVKAPVPSVRKEQLPLFGAK